MTKETKYKLLSLLGGVIGLAIGLIVGLLRHHGTWTVGISMAGALIGWLTGIEAASYLEFLQHKHRNK